MARLGIEWGSFGLEGGRAARAAEARAPELDLGDADAFVFVSSAKAHALAFGQAASVLDSGPDAGLDGALGQGLRPALQAVAIEAHPALAFETAGPVLANGSLAAPFAAARAHLPEAAATGERDVYTSGKGGMGVESDFNVTVVFAPGMAEALREDFVQAAEYLSSIITGDLRRQGPIDDIAIVAQVSEIDGPGQVLGQAGPVLLRAKGSLPSAGIMQFDEADANELDADGQFDDVVLHEMMHCLGVGTIWEQLGLLEGSVREGDIRFTGENAALAYPTGRPDAYAADPGRDGGVPVETEGGPGTAGGHWDEELFGDELMTGFLGGVPTEVSSVTVASLEDLGYETIFDPTDPARAVPQPSDLLAFA